MASAQAHPHNLRPSSLRRLPDRYHEAEVRPLDRASPLARHVLYDPSLAKSCAFPSLPLNYPELGPSEQLKATREERQQAERRPGTAQVMDASANVNDPSTGAGSEGEAAAAPDHLPRDDGALGSTNQRRAFVASLPESSLSSLYNANAAEKELADVLFNPDLIDWGSDSEIEQDTQPFVHRIYSFNAYQQHANTVTNRQRLLVSWDDLPLGVSWAILRILNDKFCFSETVVFKLRLTKPQIQHFLWVYTCHYDLWMGYDRMVYETPWAELLERANRMSISVAELVHIQRPDLPTDRILSKDADMGCVILQAMGLDGFGAELRDWVGLSRLDFVELAIEWPIMQDFLSSRLLNRAVKLGWLNMDELVGLARERAEEHLCARQTRQARDVFLGTIQDALPGPEIKSCYEDAQPRAAMQLNAGTCTSSSATAPSLAYECNSIAVSKYTKSLLSQISSAFPPTAAGQESLSLTSQESAEVRAALQNRFPSFLPAYVSGSTVASFLEQRRSVQQQSIDGPALADPSAPQPSALASAAASQPAAAMADARDNVPGTADKVQNGVSMPPSQAHGNVGRVARQGNGVVRQTGPSHKEAELPAASAQAQHGQLSQPLRNQAACRPSSFGLDPTKFEARPELAAAIADGFSAGYNALKSRSSLHAARQNLGAGPGAATQPDSGALSTGMLNGQVKPLAPLPASVTGGSQVINGRHATQVKGTVAGNTAAKHSAATRTRDASSAEQLYPTPRTQAEHSGSDNLRHALRTSYLRYLKPPYESPPSVKTRWDRKRNSRAREREELGRMSNMAHDLGSDDDVDYTPQTVSNNKRARVSKPPTKNPTQKAEKRAARQPKNISPHAINAYPAGASVAEPPWLTTSGGSGDRNASNNGNFEAGYFRSTAATAPQFGMALNDGNRPFVASSPSVLEAEQLNTQPAYQLASGAAVAQNDRARMEPRSMPEWSVNLETGQARAALSKSSRADKKTPGATSYTKGPERLFGMYKHQQLAPCRGRVLSAHYAWSADEAVFAAEAIKAQYALKADRLVPQPGMPEPSRTPEPAWEEIKLTMNSMEGDFHKAEQSARGEAAQDAAKAQFASCVDWATYAIQAETAYYALEVTGTRQGPASVEATTMGV